MKHIVALSGGKDSTALALRLAELGEHDYDFICTPTGNELPVMADHWNRLDVLLGKPLLRIVRRRSSGHLVILSKNPDFDADTDLMTLERLIEDFNALPNVWMRWCTRMLKIEIVEAYFQLIGEAVLYVGLRADEPEDQRRGIYGDKVASVFPLRDWGWGLPEVRGYLRQRNVTIPERTDCAVCFFQRLLEWKLLYYNHPNEFERGIRLERERTESRGRDTTFRSPQRDSWPASLAGLKAEFDKGRLAPGEDKYLDAIAQAKQRNLFDEDADVDVHFRQCRVCSL